MRSFIGIRHVLMGDMAAIKVLKNAICFIIGYFVALETCYVTCIDVRFCNVHSIGTINVCANFQIKIGTTLTNLENMQKSYVSFGVYDFRFKRYDPKCVF